MAGNYRSSGSGISSAVSGLVRGARSTHVKKQTMEKSTQQAKDIINHREAARQGTEKVKAAARIAVTKERGAQVRKNATHKAKLKEKSKAKNDLDFGRKKKTSEAKKPKLSKDRKW